MAAASAQGTGEQIGVVLAGGGARGAYEVGALSVLLPELERRGEAVRIIVGTSVGALNAAWLGAQAGHPAEEIARRAKETWRGIAYSDVLAPLLSWRALPRAAMYAAQVLGVRQAHLHQLLDPAPLRRTVEGLIAFDDLRANIAADVMHAVAVVGTSALTGRSVVFHAGGTTVPADDERGIDYVPCDLCTDHVLASAAIPVAFPAVYVGTPGHASGWYFDGGTRLNTPIKPALALGADRVIVIGLNSNARSRPPMAVERKPDAFEGAGHLLQAVLADPLINDMHTLANRNATGDRRIPYIFVAPERQDTIGRIAREVYVEHYAGRGPLRSSVAALGGLLCSDDSPAHADLLSYLLFAPEFADALIRRGAADARAWLRASHDDGPWHHGRLAPTAAGERVSRRTASR